MSKRHFTFYSVITNSSKIKWKKPNYSKVSCRCRKFSGNKVRRYRFWKINYRIKKTAMEASRNNWSKFSRIWSVKSRSIWIVMLWRGSLQSEFWNNILSREISRICSELLTAFCRILRYRAIFKNRVIPSRYSNKKLASRVLASKNLVLLSSTNLFRRSVLDYSWAHLINVRGFQMTKYKKR